MCVICMTLTMQFDLGYIWNVGTLGNTTKMTVLCDILPFCSATLDTFLGLQQGGDKRINS